MPTKRTRRARSRRAVIPADLIAYLKDEGEISTTVEFFTDESAIRAAWNELRDSILADWAEEWPSSRPSAWWRYDAPEPRRRVGGVGTPSHEVLNYTPLYDFGIPASFVSREQENYYTGRSRDIHGNRIGTEYAEGDFEGLAIDPSNPPIEDAKNRYPPVSWSTGHNASLPGITAGLGHRF